MHGSGMAETAGGGDQATFAQLLKRYRQAALLTQEGLAERSGLSVRAISALERGVIQRPHPETVIQLISALALTAEERARFMAAARAERMAPTSEGNGSALPLR